MHHIVARALGAPHPEFVCIPTDMLSRLAPVESEWCVENFQYNNIYDNSAARKDLDFHYTISYSEGAQRCVNWLKENNSIEDCSSYNFYEEVLYQWKDKLI